jgi:hypothetical protein
VRYANAQEYDSQVDRPIDIAAEKAIEMDAGDTHPK